MQEHDRFSMGTNPWFFAQASNVLSLESQNSSIDVINLDTNVMHSSIFVFIQKILYWTVFSQRVQ